MHWTFFLIDVWTLRAHSVLECCLLQQTTLQLQVSRPDSLQIYRIILIHWFDHPESTEVYNYFTKE